ncbi:MAG: acyloxyacyl hydrolase [Bacteroidota bacterium]|nr:acyloxyacyl hydrolase [Bacteroidota bacterium]
MKKSIGILFFFTFFMIEKPLAQLNDLPEKKITHFSISASPVYGFVFAHDIQVKNTAGTVVTGVEIKLNRRRSDEEAKHYARKNYNSGFTLAYYNFSKGFLGNAFYSSYFIEPYLINHKKFKLGLVAKAGLSYNSNPYNEITNNQNYSYSLYINPYLCLGFNTSIKAGKKLRVDFDAMFNHNSNGGFFHPNYGINFPTASLGIDYDLKKVKIKNSIPAKKFVWRFDVMPFGSYKTIPLDKDHFYWVYGFALQANRKIGFFNTVNLGVEWVADLGVKKTLEINGRSNLDYNRAGVLLGHEFIFKKFNFSQQIGIYIFNQNPYIDRIYHRWGLYYKLNKNWMAGINLSAHRQIADFLDFRAIYSRYR